MVLTPEFRNTCMILSKVDAELILSVSASPFVSGKARAQQDRLRQVAADQATVGVLNSSARMLFDGRVMVAEPNGSLIRLNAGWQPGMTVLDWDNQESHAEPDPLDELVRAAAWYSGYVRRAGHESVVLGLSGGLDSALVATLAAIAAGPEAVHGICMPAATHRPDRSMTPATWRLVWAWCICMRLGLSDTGSTDNRCNLLWARWPGDG